METEKQGIIRRNRPGCSPAPKPAGSRALEPPGLPRLSVRSCVLLSIEHALQKQPRSRSRGKSARVINYEEFKKALEELAMKRFKGKSKEEAFDAICHLVAGKEPANVGVTKAKTGGAVERLTDTSKYTGSHKERFDESGKGKGIAGRQDILDDSGYVSAYKNAGTYDAKVKK